jgi:hypothetical protein
MCNANIIYANKPRHAVATKLQTANPAPKISVNLTTQTHNFITYATAFPTATHKLTATRFKHVQKRKYATATTRFVKDHEPSNSHINVMSKRSTYTSGINHMLIHSFLPQLKQSLIKKIHGMRRHLKESVDTDSLSNETPYCTTNYH